MKRIGSRADRVECVVLLAMLVGQGLSAQGTTQDVVRLTYDGARHGQPSYSPDGARIAFVSDRSGSWQVWSMPGEGGVARQLTHGAGPVGWPSWNAAGDTLFYYAAVEEGGYRLRALSLESGAARRLFDDGVDDFRPSLSPDGRRLLFDRVDPATGRGHDVVVRELASGRVRTLAGHPGYDSDARWSPDGTSIAFHSDRDGSAPYATQVYVMDADGGSVRRLTDGPAVNGYPAWSPDGRRIAYTSEFDGNRDVWLMGADGSDRRRVTRHPGFDGDPVWSPDGRRILFVTDRFGGRELAWVEVQ